MRSLEALVLRFSPGQSNANAAIQPEQRTAQMRADLLKSPKLAGIGMPYEWLGRW